MSALDELLFDRSILRANAHPLLEFRTVRCDIDPQFRYSDDDRHTALKHLDRAGYSRDRSTRSAMARADPRRLRRALQEWMLLVLPCHFFGLGDVAAIELDIRHGEISICDYVSTWLGEKLQDWLKEVEAAIPERKWLGNGKFKTHAWESDLLHRLRTAKDEYKKSQCWFNELLTRGLLAAVSSDLAQGTQEGWRFIYSLQAAGECMLHALLAAQRIVKMNLDPDLTGNIAESLEACEEWEAGGQKVSFFKDWWDFLDVIPMDWGSNAGLVNAMTTGGTCPSLIQKLSTASACGNLMMWICAACDVKCQRLRPPQRRDHRRCTGESVCVANYEVNPHDYRPQHLAECACRPGDPLIGPDMHEVRRLIKKGEIPLLALREGSSSIEVIPRKKKLFYTAITHVWSDGCGNETGNTLPACQIDRLARLADGAPLWMDTLCIPKGSADHIYRKKAISSMNDIFYRADAVKLICNDLDVLQHQQVFQDGQKGVVGLALLIMCLSSWTSRLWTLQEAVYGGHNLEYLLPDGLTLSPKYATAYIPHAQCYIRNFVLENLVDMLSIEEGSKRKDTRGVVTIFKVMSQLRWRKTTHKSDEAVVVAAILGLKTDALVDLKEHPTRQMEKLYSMLSSFPVEVLFCQVERLNIQGLRWAPATFCIPDWSTESPSDYEHRQGWQRELGIITSTGLGIDCSLVFFETSLGKFPEVFTLDCAKKDFQAQVRIRSVSDGGQLDLRHWQKVCGGSFAVVLGESLPKTCVCMPETDGYGCLVALDDYHGKPPSGFAKKSSEFVFGHFIASVTVVYDHVAKAEGWKSRKTTPGRFVFSIKMLVD